jgi:hypothetical protein
MKKSMLLLWLLPALAGCGTHCTVQSTKTESTGTVQSSRILVTGDNPAPAPTSVVTNTVDQTMIEKRVIQSGPVVK